MGARPPALARAVAPTVKQSEIFVKNLEKRKSGQEKKNVGKVGRIVEKLEDNVLLLTERDNNPKKVKEKVDVWKKLLGNMPQKASKSEYLRESRFEDSTRENKVRNMVKDLEKDGCKENSTSGIESKGKKKLRQEKIPPTPPRSKGGGGQIIKKKKSNLTPLKSKLEAKRAFLTNNFVVSKFGASCGISGQNFQCTNPLYLVSPSRLAASQWDEPTQTGPRRYDHARGIPAADWTSQERLCSLDQPGRGTLASQEDHPEGNPGPSVS